MKLTAKTLFFYCFFFLFSWFNVTAQNTILDSLENELLLHKEEDTTRVILLNKIIYQVFRKDPKRSNLLIKEVESISKRIGFLKGEADAFFFKGQLELEKYNYAKSIDYFNKSIKIHESINNKKGVANTLNGVGTAYSYQNKFTEAIEVYEKSAKIFEEINNLKGAAGILNNIGVIYKHQGKYDKAISNYNKAKKIKAKLNDTKGVAGSFNNMAILYEEQGNFPKALENFNKAREIYIDLKEEEDQINILLHLGSIYFKQEKDSLALLYFNEALTKSEKFKGEEIRADCLYGISIIYNELSKHKEALEFLKEALEINLKANNKLKIASHLNAMSLIYLDLEQVSKAIDASSESLELNQKMGSSLGICNSYFNLARCFLAKGENKLALDNILESQKLSKDLQLTLHEKEASDLLSTIYSKMGNYKKAFESYKEFKLLDDSLFNEKNIEKITQLEYEYKYKDELESASRRELKLTKKVQVASNDLEKSQRNLLLGLIAFLLIVLILGTVIFYLRLRNVKAETQNIIIEQKLLRSQMTPHFIFNSLSVLQGIILNKEERKSILYLAKFSKLLRITLENSRDKMVSLNQELMAVENYLELQNLETKNAYIYTITVDKTIDETLFKIPPMLIQPFVENAIEHGFLNIKENRKIDIHLTYLNNLLTCIIKDNGVGVDFQKENKNHNKKSLSTTITAERIEILSKNYKIKGSVSIEDRNKYKEQGTIVTLVIPSQINKSE